MLHRNIRKGFATCLKWKKLGQQPCKFAAGNHIVSGELSAQGVQSAQLSQSFRGLPIPCVFRNVLEVGFFRRWRFFTQQSVCWLPLPGSVPRWDGPSLGLRENRAHEHDRLKAPSRGVLAGLAAHIVGTEPVELRFPRMLAGCKRLRPGRRITGSK